LQAIPGSVEAQRPSRHCALSQSASVTHDDRQKAVAGSHEKGVQAPRVCGLQVPRPSHVAAETGVGPSQRACAQTTPAAAGPQWPTPPASAQLWQAPSHRESQHTPPAQKPVAHWLPEVHGWPGTPGAVEGASAPASLRPALPAFPPAAPPAPATEIVPAAPLAPLADIVPAAPLTKMVPPPPALAELAPAAPAVPTPSGTNAGRSRQLRPQARSASRQITPAINRGVGCPNEGVTAPPATIAQAGPTGSRTRL
jgi:hypothetical protein